MNSPPVPPIGPVPNGRQNPGVPSETFRNLILATASFLWATTAGFPGGLLAQQQQPVVPSVLPAGTDPLRSSTLSPELEELAAQSLPADEAGWGESLPAVFSFIEEIPLTTLEQGAFKYRRARIRLTEDSRSGRPFRMMKDLADSPEHYWGRPVAFHGYLKSLESLPGPNGEQDVWHLGRLKLWNSDRTLRFLTRLLPENLPNGDDLHEPAEVIGYLFPVSAEAGGSPVPLIVARGVRWLKPELDLRTLVNVRDRTIGIPDEEADAYYRTLLHAKLIDPSALEQQADAFWKERQQQLSRPRPLFVDLFKTFEADPNIYRGQPVTLEGTLRKLRQIPTDPMNSFGIETLYEGWLFAEDAQSNPAVVVFTENPANLPEGDDLAIPVKVTGYVFKMYGYQSRDKEHPLRVAPMLLARSVKQMVLAERKTISMTWVAAGLGLLCLGLVLFVWSSSRKDRKLHEQILRGEETEEPPQFDQLDDDKL